MATSLSHTQARVPSPGFHPDPVGKGMAVTHWMVDKFFYERNLVVELARYLPSRMLRRTVHEEVSQFCHRLALAKCWGSCFCCRGWQPHAHQEPDTGNATRVCCRGPLSKHSHHTRKQNFPRAMSLQQP